MSSLLLIDGNNLIFRAHFAHQSLVGPEGPTSVLFGTTSMLYEALNRLPGSVRIIMLWDAARGPDSWRAKIFPAYKANRENTEDRQVALSQLPALTKMLRGIGIEQYKVPGLEADDLAGILSRIDYPQHEQVFILSKDSDLLQLVRTGVHLLWPVKGKVEYMDKTGVKAMVGVYPRHIPSLKALQGDATDNVKVLAGIGPKRAVEMMSHGLDPRYKWQDLPREARAKYAKFESQWPTVRNARRVTKILTDPTKAPDAEAAVNMVLEVQQRTKKIKRGRLEYNHFADFCLHNNIQAISHDWLEKLW